MDVRKIFEQASHILLSMQIDCTLLQQMHDLKEMQSTLN